MIHGDGRRESDHDLTTQHAGEPIGQRIVVFGQVRDTDGRAVPDTLVEIWQANAAGRYAHARGELAGPAGPQLHRRRPRR